MNIEEIDEYHDTIANTRKLLGDVHAGDASRSSIISGICNLCYKDR